MKSGLKLTLLVAVGLLLTGTLLPFSQEAQTPATITGQERDGVLAAHNTARQNDVPGNTGGPLRPLEWDDGLAAASQAYAETTARTQCGNPDHDANRGDVGENLFSANTTDPQAPPRGGADAVAPWVAEKADYTYASNTCNAGKVCGHYTQVVWRDTTKLGCGRATCSANGMFHTHWVCRYSPTGNMNVDTTKPY